MIRWFSFVFVVPTLFGSSFLAAGDRTGLPVKPVAEPTIAFIGTTPCGVEVPRTTSPGGLTPVDSGSIVNDSNQGLCWLADANLAGHPEVRASVQLSPTNRDGTTPVINPDGTMNYETALNWVASLNSYNGGKGWLNHNNWQLPTNPEFDTNCTSVNVDNFGALCTRSGMGYLYNVALDRTYPDSVAPDFFSFVSPFLNLEPALYWTSDINSGGQVTFSFNTGIGGANTTKYNFFRVLPMTKAVLGPLPAGAGVLPYRSGLAEGKAVYDTHTGLSWTMDANLPAALDFGFTGKTTIVSGVNSSVLTLPMIQKDGTVYFSAVDPANTSSGWIVSMNASEYAGTNTWRLPTLADLKQLYADMAISAGDARLEWPFFVGPFWRLQPGFYWGCVRAAHTGSNGVCDYTQDAPAGLEWSFNFDDGFEGTDLKSKQFYVMINYPAP